jgi:hypothetical protein
MGCPVAWEVFERVLVLRLIAAANVTAGHAHAERGPGIAQGLASTTSVRLRLHIAHRAQVPARHLSEPACPDAPQQGVFQLAHGPILPPGPRNRTSGSRSASDPMNLLISMPSLCQSLSGSFAVARLRLSQRSCRVPTGPGTRRQPFSELKTAPTVPMYFPTLTRGLPDPRDGPDRGS